HGITARARGKEPRARARARVPGRPPTLRLADHAHAQRVARAPDGTPARARAPARATYTAVPRTRTRARDPCPYTAVPTFSRLQRQQTPSYLDLIGTTPSSHDGEEPRMQAEDAASSPGEITRLAAQWGAGDRDA